MIGKLSGLVDSQGEDHVILDVGGVGYLVYCSGRTLAALPPAGGRAGLLVDTHVREDHIHLYGFADGSERDWFRLLSTVQGVGARMALAILGVLSPDELPRAIAAQDRSALTRANGVGPKLAARIVSELKEKAGKALLGAGAHLPAVERMPGAGAQGRAEAADDAVSALVNLGYARTEAFTAIAHAARKLGEGASLEALIKGGLRELSS